MLTKQKYSYTAGIDWLNGRVAPTGVYRENGYYYTLFKKLTIKVIKRKIGVKPETTWFLVKKDF